MGATSKTTATRPGRPAGPVERQDVEDDVDGDLVDVEQTALETGVGSKPRPRRRGRRGRGGGWVLRAQTRPHQMLAGLALAAAAARLAARLSGEEALVALAVAAVALVVTVVAAIVGRRRTGRRWGRWERTCAAAAIGWLAAVTAAGITWDAIGILTVFGYALALPWWRRHRIPDPEPARARSRRVPLVPVEPGVLAGLWRENIAGKDGPLPKSYLTDPVVEGGNEVFTVQLLPGKQSVASLRGNLLQVASGLRVAVEDLVAEAHPTARDASMARLTVVRRSTVRTTVTYPGPRWRYDPDRREGVVDLGPYADGAGYAPWRLFSKGSMWGGIVIGGIGSGKSRLLEGLCCSALSSGLVTLWFADPQGGTSSVALADHADWTARSPEQAVEMLRALWQVVQWRGKENSLRGRTGYTPTPDRPGILAVIEECHMVFGNRAPILTPFSIPDFLAGKPPKSAGEEATILAECISRIGRKVGVGLVLASQEGDLMSTFGGSNGLRSAAQRGNTVVLHTKNTQAKGTLGLDFNPCDLPLLPGFGYTVTSADLGGRTAPFRGFYLDELDDDEYDPVRDGATPRAGTGYWWLARQQQGVPGLDPVALRAAGPAYADRHTQAEETLEALETELALLLAGGINPGQPVTGTQPAATTSGGTGGGAQIIDFPTWPPTTPADTAAADGGAGRPAGPEQPGRRRTAVDVVYDLIASGVTRTGDLEARSGYSEARVRQALTALVDAGRVRNVGRGRWTLAA